uniref:Uncharacterized protein n=1 Tax=Medicago truncatula TaxID=3880 RepID=I3RZF9_MEDTR|nr:unknown [Medicago truncatula]
MCLSLVKGSIFPGRLFKCTLLSFYGF